MRALKTSPKLWNLYSPLAYLGAKHLTLILKVPHHLETQFHSFLLSNHARGYCPALNLRMLSFILSTSPLQEIFPLIHSYTFHFCADKIFRNDLQSTPSTRRNSPLATAIIVLAVNKKGRVLTKFLSKKF